MSSEGLATLPRKRRSFPTAATFASISSEFEATVTPSTGKAFAPCSIQKPCAWKE